MTAGLWLWRVGNRLESRQLAPRRAVVEVYICLVRSTKQRGLSTTFGWRLTPLKMTNIWGVRACRACGGPFISARVNPRPSGAWTGHPFTATRASAANGGNVYLSREMQAAAGSFDYVRLAPHSAQDDRHVECEGAQGVRRPIDFRPNKSPPKRSLDGAPVHGNSRLGGLGWKCISVSGEIPAAAGSFDYVRLAPHSAQDDRHLGCQGVQGVRRSINFRPK